MVFARFRRSHWRVPHYRIRQLLFCTTLHSTLVSRILSPKIDIVNSLWWFTDERTPDLVSRNERKFRIKRGMNVKCVFFFSLSLKTSPCRPGRGRVRDATWCAERKGLKGTIIRLGTVAMSVWTYTNPFVVRAPEKLILSSVWEWQGA